MTAKQMGLQLSLKHVQWQAAVTQCWWQTVPHCEPLEGEAALAHQRDQRLHSLHVDISSRWRPQSRTSLNSLHRHAEFLQIWRYEAVDAFPYEDRSLENDSSPHWKPVEATYGVMWSRRRAPVQTPDTRRAAVFCTDYSRFVWMSVIAASRALQ